MSVRRPDGSVKHTYSSQMPPAKTPLPENSAKTGNLAQQTDAITNAYKPSTGEKARSFEDQTSMENYLRAGNLHVPIKF